MKRYAKPTTDTSGFFVKEEPEAPPSDVSIARLLDDGLIALYREMKNLLVMSSKGKLSAANARDLRDHLKLLFELKDRENELLRGLTDEQLAVQAKAALEADSEAK
jgi:hypothetical protein